MRKMHTIYYQNHPLITTNSFSTNQKRPRFAKNVDLSQTRLCRLAVHSLPPGASSKPRTMIPGRQAVPSPGTQNCTREYEPPGGFEDPPGSFWKISRNVKLYSF